MWSFRWQRRMILLSTLSKESSLFLHNILVGSNSSLRSSKLLWLVMTTLPLMLLYRSTVRWRCTTPLSNLHRLGIHLVKPEGLEFHLRNMLPRCCQPLHPHIKYPIIGAFSMLHLQANPILFLMPRGLWRCKQSTYSVAATLIDVAGG
jgi:hypothetical protein